MPGAAHLAGDHRLRIRRGAGHIGLAGRDRDGCGAVGVLGAPQASPVPDGTQGSPAPGANTPPAAGGRPPAVSDPGARVEADDQSGDGRSVVVRETAVTVGPGWLAIITDDDDGRLLGSVALQPGQAGPFTVALTEPVPGDDDDDLTVVLHLDDGDGLFDALRDPRVLDDDDDDDDDDDFDYDLG